MRYGTVCSGVEAFGPAWEAMGYECAFHAEIATHPSAVLRYHFPDVPNYEDFTTIEANDATRIDLLAGGTPCQDFSIAGLRAGIAGAKGNLSLEFLLLAKRLGVKWILWENVPGTFSSISHDPSNPSPPPPPLDMERDGQEVDTEDEYDAEESHAFQSFLAGLSELGYGFAYRTFDAQYFGVPQRRRRIFLVAHFGDWRPAAAVLFESESLRGNPTPSREAGQNLAGTLTATTSGSGPASRLELAATGYLQTVGTLAAGYSKNGAPDVDAGLYVGVCATGEITHTLTAEGHDASEDGTGRGTPIIAGTLCAGKKSAGSVTQQDAHAGLLVFDTKQITSKENRSRVEEGMPAPTLTKGMEAPAIAYQCHGGSVGQMGVLRAGNGSMTGGVPFVAAFKQGAGADAGSIGYAEEQAPTLTGSSSGTQQSPAICFGWNKSASQTMRVDTETSDAVQAASSSQPAALVGSAVRRLTPLECERLMGYPDNWTQYGTYANGQTKLIADGPRYQMCGNGWATPVANWVAERLMMVEKLLPPTPPTIKETTPENLNS